METITSRGAPGYMYQHIREEYSVLLAFKKTYDFMGKRTWLTEVNPREKKWELTVESIII